MPRKNKKKNRKQIEAEQDWDKSGSSESEMISSKDISNKNKKKNKKNKNKKSDLDLSENEQPPSPPPQNKKKKKKNKKNKAQSKDLDASDDEQFTKPVQKLSKKELRKLKKMKKYQEESPEPDWEAQETPPTSPQNKKKGKKGKKGKRAAMNEGDLDKSDEEEFDHRKNKKNKKKNKGKSKKAKERERVSKLLALKQERQETLLGLGNDLMGNLDIKYAPYFDDEVKELWEAQILEFVDFYEDEYQQKVQDEELLNAKKDEMKASWDEIFELISQDYEEAAAERDAAKKEKEREKKIEAFRAQGLNIGRTVKKKQIDRKEQKKREEKEKLKALKARLAEMDRLAVQQEKEQKAKESQERQKKEKEKERKQKREEAEKKKRGKIEAAQNDNWEDSSDSDQNDTEPKPKKDNSKSNNKKNGHSKLDSSDDEWGDSTQNKAKPKPKPKQKPKPKPKPKVTNLDDSDNEQQQQQNTKKKRGGRRRKTKQPQPAAGGKKKNDTKIESSEASKENTKPNTPESEQKKSTKSQSNKPKPKSSKASKAKQAKPAKQAKQNKKKELRSPICVVMGHVDHGKTKILDHIRHTTVQNKEAGGITQQIGATYLSIGYIKDRTSRLKEQVAKLKYKVPGLLFIDTPGHESFSNLRSRGSSMCDIAVLVIDLMQGFQPQTVESLNMLTARKSPFVVALNKIDMCYDWKVDENAPFLTTYNKQTRATQNDFEHRLAETKLAFNRAGMNAEIYFKNKRLDKDISLVPTSAITGEGIPDLLYLIVQLTKKYMSNAISFNANKTKCSVLEVKQTQGYGATIDVIVSNGTLKADDTLVICGMNGPIVTGIKALLLPHEAQEMRVKGEYNAVAQVSASVGVRIAAVEDLQFAVAGSPLFIVPRKLKPKNKDRERRECIENLKDEVQESFTELFSAVDKTGRGVFVQASTLGALEALITFLTAQKIPICGIGIGTVAKKTIMKAAVMLNFQKEFAVVLAFNVKVAPDARHLATEQGVRIFEAEIIYHLQDQFEAYIKKLKEERKKAAEGLAVFPCEFKILSPEHVFHNKNPFVFGVSIVRGSLHLNTPIMAQRWNASKIATPIYLGRVDSIKSENKDIPIAKVGDKVSVRIQADGDQKNVQVGRSFDMMDPLISEITRDSIDALKANFEEEMKEDQDCVQHLGLLKKYFNII